MKKITVKKTSKQTFARNLVVVVGAGFRCMAFRDIDGRLRNFWNGTILPLPLHILDPES